MLTAEMIAPCGLNCALCAAALRPENPCPGCNGPDENKPDFCRSLCGIVQCRQRKLLPGLFCSACPSYPCDDIMEKETRYTSAYPLRESPMENLQYITENGMEKFLERECKIWKCPVCGGIICVHTGICSQCGRTCSGQKP